MKETHAECNFSCRPKLPFLTYFKDIKFEGLDSWLNGYEYALLAEDPNPVPSTNVVSR